MTSDQASSEKPSAAAIAEALERWFAGAKRDLPWRRPARSDDDRAWRCLVAESMLQQTQVSRVVERFERFIGRFSTPAALAAADEQAVLAEWQGLGYYRRARNLQAAARVIVDEFGGRTPREVRDLLRLPGVGRYTAGAIASIAFGAREPIVDGNVMRVVSRLVAIDEPVERSSTQKRIWSVAEALVKACARPENFNQAIMELGSLVCTPRGAQCGECPVKGHCVAHRDDRVHELPRAKTPPKRSIIHAATLPVRRRGRWLLVQRPASGLWSNMWQAPTLEHERPITRAALSRYLKENFGLAAEGLRVASTFTHQTSHRQVEITVWDVKRITGRARIGRWIDPDELHTLPLSNAQRRVLASTDLLH